MQIKITGRIIGAQPLFDNGSFRKQTLIVESANGNFTNYYPVDFTQGDIDTLLPQVQMNGAYEFTVWVQGSSKQMTDKNGSPTAYLNLKVSAVVPAGQQQAPQQGGFQQPQQQGGFQQPQQTQQNFQQPTQNNGFGGQQGGIGGQPAQGGFSQPQQPQGFGAPQQNAQPPQQSFGTPQQNNPFGQQQ